MSIPAFRLGTRGSCYVLCVTAGAFTVAGHAAENLAPDPSFETLPPGTEIGGSAFFSTLGMWGIDPGEIVEAQGDVVPAHGDQMLKFVGHVGELSDDIYAMLDATDLPPVLDLTARFNATETSSFRVTFLAFEESESELPLHWNEYDDIVSCEFQSDDDPETWEMHGVRYVVPEGINLLAIGVNSGHDSAVSRFADDVQLAAPSADLDDNGVVSFADLIMLLSAWGECDVSACDDALCEADLDADGVVGFADLLLLLGAWT